MPRSKYTSLALWGLAILLFSALVLSLFLMKGEASFAIRPYLTTLTIKGDKRVTHHSFVSLKEIEELIPFDKKDSLLISVNTSQLEKNLEENLPYVESAEVYVSPATNQLNIRLQERSPIAYFFPNGEDGRSYYLDLKGNIIKKRRSVSAYLPLAVGVLNDSTVMKTLYPLAKFLYEEPNYRSFFGLIEIVSERTIRLYPRIGSEVFEIHGLSTLEEDFKKLRRYYKDIRPKMGYNTYSLVKLSYQNQIVCVRSKEKHKP